MHIREERGNKGKININNALGVTMPGLKTRVNTTKEGGDGLLSITPLKIPKEYATSTGTILSLGASQEGLQHHQTQIQESRPPLPITPLKTPKEYTTSAVKAPPLEAVREALKAAPSGSESPSSPDAPKTDRQAKLKRFYGLIKKQRYEKAADLLLDKSASEIIKGDLTDIIQKKNEIRYGKRKKGNRGQGKWPNTSLPQFNNHNVYTAIGRTTTTVFNDHAGDLPEAPNAEAFDWKPFDLPEESLDFIHKTPDFKEKLIRFIKYLTPFGLYCVIQGEKQNASGRKSRLKKKQAEQAEGEA